MRWTWLGGLLLVASFAGAPAQAQKSADILRVTWNNGVVNIDPYYNQLRTGLVIAHHAWDTLIYRDPETFVLKPLLATAWKYVDDTTIEFDLRRGATFHDGSPFTADDVVYTINRVLTDAQVAVPSNYTFLVGAEKIDAFKVRVKLKRVFPAALEYLSMTLPIWPQAYRERIGAAAYAKAPVGTGPYRITRVGDLSDIEFERFETYFADSPKGKPAIRQLRIHQVSDATAEMTELLGNRADWTWNFLADNFDNVARMPNLQAMRAESMRVGYLSLDAAGRTGAGNPLTNEKVRQAIFYAIDRQAIAKQLVQGGSRVPDGPCYPTQFGCDSSGAARYDYNPARARALLTEAGYPNGFETEIVSYVLPQYEGAIQNYLSVVGIQARITHLTVSAAIQRTLAGTAPMNLGTWGSYSINDVSAFLPFFFAGNDTDYSRDPALKALIDQGGSSTKPDERRRFYGQAIKLVMEKAYFLPLHSYVTTYGVSRTLNFKPYPDELPRFFLASWK